MQHALVEWSVRALIMAVCTAVVLLVTRATAASARHRLWTGTMLAMLLLPVWTAWGPSLNARIVPSANTSTALPFPVSDPVSVDAPGVQHPVPTYERMNPSSSTAHLDLVLILLAVYLTGVAFMMVRLARGTVLARRLRNTARAEGGFSVSAHCAVPVTIGWFRPAILLPRTSSAWPSAQLNAVLAHEREHVRRRDPLVQWLALFNRCIYWFHPVAWWLERKLAALAEEACDAAVLAQGYSPHDYAGHLLEMARLVSAHGVRVRYSGAAGIFNGSMQHRIRRIVDFRPVHTSPARAAASATVCLILLVACLSCSIGSKQTPRKTYASMADQDRRAQTELRVRSDQWREEETLLQDAAPGLTPDRAKLREAELKNNPDQPYRARELVMYYQSTRDLKALNELTLWFIAHRPDSRQDWGTRPPWDTVWDPGGYHAARQAWLDQLNQARHSAKFYMNAGEYLSGHDNERAEQIFLEGQRRFPDASLHWEVFLARHYAWALTGAGEQLPASRYNAGAEQSSNSDAYANQVRRKLLASSDAELLDRVVEQLQANKPNAELVKALIDRIFALYPNNRQAHMRSQNMRRQNVMQRAKSDLRSLNDSDRMLWMESQLSYGRNVPDREAMAGELLAIAARNAKDSSCGAATLIANLILGEAALRRGDKAGAVRHLIAAGNAPPDEYLRYNQINMTLPRQLVDAGERDQVARFLDQCAAFGGIQEHLADWATQIRRGENPRLFPNFDPLAANFGFTE
jgi:beta-lactamase regulating signal transducer with metallopeptidase domain